MRLDEKIRKLRTDAGLSQQQLADALSVSRAAVAKWENDNGTPDVENLKALAAYFQCDLDRLLDDNKDLQASEADELSYCGKNCEACTCREGRSCPGCRQGPAADSHLGCAIGACCKRQYHNSCDSCGRKDQCTLLQTSAEMPALLDQRIQQRKQQNEMLRRKKMFLGKWTWVLFWMIVPEILVGFMIAEPVANKFPSLHVLGNILQIAISVAYGIILLLLATHSKEFKIAGCCALVLSGFGLVVLLGVGKYVSNANFVFLLGGVIDSSDSNMFFLLPVSPLSLVYTYYYHKGFAGVLEDVDWELSEKWRKLWKAYVLSLCTLFGCTLLGVMHILALLMLILILCAAVSILVLTVLRIVYLFKTARAFRTVYI